MANGGNSTKPNFISESNSEKGRRFMKKVYVILQNGHVFEGRSFGADGRVVGEIVFTTGVVGYLETMTDPSYYGQIVVGTFPLIGNYGVIPADMQSNKLYPKAYIVREFSDEPSNYRCEGTIDSWLKENGVVGVCGIDTRALTKIIREYGVMNAIITDTLPDPIVPDEVLTYKVEDAVMSVTTKEIETYACESSKYNVALYDFGVKKITIDSLLNMGCNVTVFPADTSAATILEGNFDGVVLSDGPGNPKDNIKITLELRKIFGQLPIFGISLGHQLLATAAGAITAKLKYGHRGGNQPVRDVKLGRVYITSQAHRYTVLPATLPTFAKIRYLNHNDGTVEGIDYDEKYAITCQFIPEATTRSRDNRVMYERFIALMDEFKNKEEK